MAPNPIVMMFGRSPIRPLQKHMAKVFACAEALMPFLDAAIAKDWPRATEAQKVISALEDDADDLKKDLRLHLPKGLFMPIPRGDLLELLTAQDQIANMAEDISGIILGRQLEIPAIIAEDFLQFAKRSVRAAEQANTAINELDELLETGFRGKEVQVIEDMIVKLDAIEHDTDDMQIAIRSKLYAIEQELNPVDVIFLYEVIHSTGDLADRAQQVGNQIHVLLAR